MLCSYVALRPCLLCLTRMAALETGANQRKFHCRSASAHQLTSPGTHLQSTGKLKFPRTFSATMVKNEGKEQNIDGFDVEKWSCGSASPVATAGCKEGIYFFFVIMCLILTFVPLGRRDMVD